MARELSPDRWKKLQEELDIPVKLSETERDKIKELFKTMHGLLDDDLEIILDLDRDDAYRYTDLIIQGFMTADINFIAGVEVEEGLAKPKEEKTKEEAVEMGPRPDLHEILGELTEGERGKAKHLLDCVKIAVQLQEEGDPRYNEALCYGLDRVCNAEEMRKCIRTEDPTVEDPMDKDLKAARR